jgi:Peptidase inhibitor I78 family
MMKDEKMTLRLIPVLGVALTLAACGGGGSPTPTVPIAPKPAGVDACGASELQDMVGQSQDELARIKFAVPVRVITPGMAVTADFQANRLNFTIGEDGKIASIACT